MPGYAAALPGLGPVARFAGPVDLLRLVLDGVMNTPSPRNWPTANADQQRQTYRACGCHRYGTYEPPARCVKSHEALARPGAAWGRGIISGHDRSQCGIAPTSTDAWVNPRDPARASAPDGRAGAQPARARSTLTSPTSAGTTGAGSSPTASTTSTRSPASWSSPMRSARASAPRTSSASTSRPTS